MQSNGLDLSARLRVRHLEAKDGSGDGAVGTGELHRPVTGGNVEELRMVNDINESANRIEQMINTVGMVRPEEVGVGGATMRHGVQKSVRFELSEEERRAGVVDPFADVALAGLQLNKDLSAHDYLRHAQQLENII